MKDVFKMNLFENAISVSVMDSIVSLVLAFLIGIFIYEVYKKTHQGVMISSNYGLSLIALTMISTFVILAVTNNVVLSLGMVGALSIVRFRTAVKDPLDIIFLFWAISAGIVLAAQMLFLAVIGSIIIGVMMLIFCRKKNRNDLYVLILKCSAGFDDEKAVEAIKSKTKKMCIKNKIVSEKAVELHYDVFLDNGNAKFVDEVMKIEGVNNVAMLSYNGDYSK